MDFNHSGISSGLLHQSCSCMHRFNPFLSILLFINVFMVQQSSAQTPGIDKIKVLDYFQNQQFEEAIDYLQPALGNDSVNMQALGFLGYAYYMNDNNRAAEQCYLKMYNLDSNNVTACHYLATIYNRNQLGQSQYYIFRLISLQPTKAAYYRNMGELLNRKKQPDSAILYFNQAYTLSPNDVRTVAGLSEARLDPTQYAIADSLLAIGLAKDSLQITYLKLCIRSAFENKAYDRVLAPGETLVRLNDISLQAINRLAVSYYNLKRYADCIRVCEAMIENGLELEGLYYYEAKSWGQLKEYNKSNELYAICLSKAIAKTADMYYYELGQNYEATKDFKKAVTMYDTAFYLFKSPLMLYNCGRIYEVELKDEAMARKYYQRYLALAKPEAADEKKAYTYVKEKWGRKGAKR
jgi:tetratricopeptide (TPR) repeat protein